MKKRREKKKKRWKRPWLWRAGPKQGRGLGGERGLCLGPQGWKRPPEVWEVGFRLSGTEGTQACLPPLVSGGGGPHLGAQHASQGRVGGANTLCSSPAPAAPVMEGPSRLPFLFPPPPRPPSYAPRTNGALRGPLRAGVGPGPITGQASPADWAEETLGVLPPDPSPQGSLRAWEPLPPLSHPSGAPSGLHFSSPLSPPHVLPVRLGVPPVSLGVEVPHQHPAGWVYFKLCCTFSTVISL